MNLDPFGGARGWLLLNKARQHATEVHARELAAWASGGHLSDCPCLDCVGRPPAVLVPPLFAEPTIRLGEVPARDARTGRVVSWPTGGRS